MKKERRHWTADEKVKLLRRHLIENIPISKICEEASLAPSLFHRWQEQLFQNAGGNRSTPNAIANWKRRAANGSWPRAASATLK